MKTEHHTPRTFYRMFLTAGLALAVSLGFAAAPAHASAEMTMSRSIAGTGGFVPGSTVRVSVELNVDDASSLSAVALNEHLPAGWTYAGTVKSGGANLQPAVGDSGEVNFVWIIMPSFPATIEYMMQAPEAADDLYVLAGETIYRTFESGELSTGVVETALHRTVMTMSREVEDYVPGEQFRVDVVLESAEALELTALALMESLPEGFSYAGGFDLAGAAVQPAAGATGELAFIWVQMPELPVHVSYAVQALATASGSYTLSGEALYRTNGGELSTPAVYTEFGEAETEAETEGPRYHSADTNQDYRITLAEVLRVIQFYNTGHYSCDATTEDGYRPGGDNFDCAPHDSDFLVQDWSISLPELLRLVQFMNMPNGAYHVNPETEDGFAPGP